MYVVSKYKILLYYNVTKYTSLCISNFPPFRLHKNEKDDKIISLFSFRNQSHDINEFYSKRKLFFRMFIIFYCLCPQGSSLLQIKLSFGLKEISNESKIFNIILYFLSHQRIESGQKQTQYPQGDMNKKGRKNLGISTSSGAHIILPSQFDKAI